MSDTEYTPTTPGEHTLMPNMLRVLGGGNRALADQVIAEVEDSLWLAEHEAAKWMKALVDALVVELRSTIVTDEMVERAASAMWDRWGHPGMFPHAPVHRQNSFRTDARAALEAALSTERGEGNE